MRTSLVVLFALSFVSGLAAPSAGLEKAFVDDTKRYFSRLEKVGFSGVLLVAENGRPVIAQGYGLANRERGLRWGPTTVSTIGSITKQFTAAAILKLAEAGRVGVRDALGKYFDGVPTDKETITLHHLLTHSSGITDPPDIGDFDPVGRDEYVRRVLEAPLAFTPGERYEYSNANYSLLGAVIELMTGKNYEGAMHELVFRPAGLKDTGYTLPAWDDKRVAQGYRGTERWGTVLERPMGEDGPYWALRANGGIHSTAHDMLRWAGVLLDNKILSERSREALWTPHVDESNGEGASFYGYGWVVLSNFAPNVRVITHNGGNGIHFADMAIVPEKNIVVFLQTNVVAEFSLASNLLTQIGERMFGGTPYPYVPAVAAVKPAKLAVWAGTYTLENGDRLEVGIDGNALRILPQGWTAYACVHSAAEQDAAALVEMSREIDRIVGAYVNGDFTPLYEAYRREVPVEQLEQTYSERQGERIEEFGPFKEYQVLGTGTGDRYHFTLVRFRHERGDVTRAYVWDRKGDGRLLGVTRRRMEPATRFFPVGDGRFESWDPATGASVAARVEKTGDGTVVFRLTRGAGDVVARR